VTSYYTFRKFLQELIKFVHCYPTIIRLIEEVVEEDVGEGADRQHLNGGRDDPQEDVTAVGAVDEKIGNALGRLKNKGRYPAPLDYAQVVLLVVAEGSIEKQAEEASKNLAGDENGSGGVERLRSDVRKLVVNKQIDDLSENCKEKQHSPVAS